MFDPMIFALLGPLGAGITGKLIHKKLSNPNNEKYVQVTFYSSNGEKEVKEVLASEAEDLVDDNGFKITYSNHHTRQREIEIFGHGITPCDCYECAEDERARQREIEFQRQVIIDLERAEQQKILAAKRKAEREEQHRKTMAAFHKGEYNHLSARQILKMGIPKQDVIALIGGVLVWPEYAISGTEDIKWERAEDKFYKIIRTYYPNGEMAFKRDEVSEEEYEKHQPTRPIVSEKARLGADRKALILELDENRKKNAQYLQKLSNESKRYDELLRNSRW